MLVDLVWVVVGLASVLLCPLVFGGVFSTVSCWGALLVHDNHAPDHPLLPEMSTRRLALLGFLNVGGMSVYVVGVNDALSRIAFGMMGATGASPLLRLGLEIVFVVGLLLMGGVVKVLVVTGFVACPASRAPVVAGAWMVIETLIFWVPAYASGFLYHGP